MQHINYNSTERHSDVTKASPMTPLKQFVFDIFFFNYNRIFYFDYLNQNAIIVA